MFAISALGRTPLEVSVKCEPELASRCAALVRDLVEDSYDLVVSALPRRQREQLGWSPAEPSGR